jgi:hypothetical protein
MALKVLVLVLKAHHRHCKLNVLLRVRQMYMGKWVLVMALKLPLCLLKHRGTVLVLLNSAWLAWALAQKAQILVNVV